MAANRLSDRFARACLCYPAAHMDFTEEQKASEEEAEAMAKSRDHVEVLTKMGEFFMDWPENYIHEGSVPTFIYHSQMIRSAQSKALCSTTASFVQHIFPQHSMSLPPVSMVSHSEIRRLSSKVTTFIQNFLLGGISSKNG